MGKPNKGETQVNLELEQLLCSGLIQNIYRKRELHEIHTSIIIIVAFKAE